uniref:Ciliary BBSome complex subunit 2 C-terminal domain-containing protein n=1 Tax=Meloidogyne incognita TaxID=6306 RepID=A0A914MUN6_MELIC
MDERYQVNERLSSEMVERINFVRECVVRAEDMLVIRDFSDARKLYGRLTILNKELIGQKTVRMAARKELLDGLKLLNVSIDQFARLRVGEPSYSLIQECRKAIANDNLEALPKLFEFGV